MDQLLSMLLVIQLKSCLLLIISFTTEKIQELITQRNKRKLNLLFLPYQHSRNPKRKSETFF